MIYVSSYYYICPHTMIYVFSYYYVCVLILLCMSPHTNIYVCPHAIIHVSSYYFYYMSTICVLILLYKDSDDSLQMRTPI